MIILSESGATFRLCDSEKAVYSFDTLLNEKQRKLTLLSDTVSGIYGFASNGFWTSGRRLEPSLPDHFFHATRTIFGI